MHKTPQKALFFGICEMKMEGEEAAGSWWKKMMIETAKQELELLESNHPNQFEFFKNELKSIIPLQNDPPSSSIATEASTSVMKRKRKSRRLSTNTSKAASTRGVVERRKLKEDESVEVALKRAKACLRKIHDLKIQLLIC